MNNKTISIIYNTTHYVIKFRLPLIFALQKAGYKVVVIAPQDQSAPLLRSYNVEHVPIQMSQYGMNPASEIRSIIQIKRILKKINPLVTLNYTAKPNTVGSIAAELAGIPVINNIAGAGMIYSSDGGLRRLLVSMLYRRGLRKSGTVFFQNSDDMQLFLNEGLVRREQCYRLPGSGVDLKRFTPSALPEGPVKFLFIGRLLHLKGIKEFLVAANAVLNSSDTQGSAEFHIVGEHEASNAFISRAELEALTVHPGMHFHGAVEPNKVENFIKDASCVVLPTYYGEGVPRVLLEACASARPIITTDNPGSRDVIEHERNGYMVKPRDTDSLTEAMQRFIQISQDEKAAMGLLGRSKAEREFDETIVIHRYLERIVAIEKVA